MFSDQTLLALAGRPPISIGSPINMPVERASTILCPTVEAMEKNEAFPSMLGNVCYGALGTGNAFALCDAINRLEEGAGTVLLGSGLASCVMSLLSFVTAGDHVLMTDAVYGPQKEFCTDILSRFGVETTFYDPALDAVALEKLIKANTRVLYAESPASQTFEMQDIPALAEAAHRRNVLLMTDNTWGGPLCFKPLAHGADICIEAVTKFIAGHSDLVMGAVTARTEELYRRIRLFCIQTGQVASPDDCYLALRGLRTMKVRMEAQFKTALSLSAWLDTRPEVERVFFPPLPNDPGHLLWQRDFHGGGALFSIALRHGYSHEAVCAMLNSYRYFSLGASWGGYASLVQLCHPERSDFNSSRDWIKSHALIRFAVGLEDETDLRHDLENGFQRLAQCL